MVFAAPEAAPTHHLALEAIRALQQLGHLLKLCGGQGSANPAGAHATAALIQQGHHRHGDAELLAQSQQILRSTAAAMAKPEVLTDHHRLGLQLLLQQGAEADEAVLELLDSAGRWLRREQRDPGCPRSSTKQAQAG